MNSWIIKVKITDYNIFGAAREFGNALPWNFDDGKDACVGDKVYFYLTNSEVGDATPAAGELLKRFLFKGEIKEITEEYLDYDEKYWTNPKHKKEAQDKTETYAVIEIQESIYDKKITSRAVDDGNIWSPKYISKGVYKLDQNTVDILENAH